MRNKFAEVLFKLSKKDKKIRVVAADISPEGKMNELSKKHPDRFINVGVAESSMISMCAGLAMRGFKPFAYTIATFALFRPFEMIRIDIAYQNLPVVIVGMGAGTVYSTLGATHMSQEDVSVVRSIPNFTILNPCDPLELESCLNYLVKKNNSPCYLKIGKRGEKIFTYNSYEKWQFNKPRTIIKGRDICLIASGPIIKFFFEIVEDLKKFKIYPSIISFHTLKPLNKNEIKKIFTRYKYMVTLEDSSEINGLATIMKESAFNLKFKGKIDNFSLKDLFLKNYGSHEDLLKDHGITKQAILKKIKKNFL